MNEKTSRKIKAKIISHSLPGLVFAKFWGREFFVAHFHDQIFILLVPINAYFRSFLCIFKIFLVTCSDHLHDY